MVAFIIERMIPSISIEIQTYFTLIWIVDLHISSIVWPFACLVCNAVVIRRWTNICPKLFQIIVHDRPVCFVRTNLSIGTRAPTDLVLDNCWLRFPIFCGLKNEAIVWNVRNKNWVTIQTENALTVFLVEMMLGYDYSSNAAGSYFMLNHIYVSGVERISVHSCHLLCVLKCCSRFKIEIQVNKLSLSRSFLFLSQN